MNFRYKKKEEHKVKMTNRAIQGRDCNLCKTINQYSFVGELGRGTFAKVR
jgi:[calcium/calmodulin-dependent protein kinase] kinase